MQNLKFHFSLFAGLILFASAVGICAQTPADAARAESWRVELPKLPVVSIMATPSYGVAPMFVGFMVSSSEPEVRFATYRWDFGDGQISTRPPTLLFHTYAKPGSYVATLIATTVDGHQATAFAGVIVK